MGSLLKFAMLLSVLMFSCGKPRYLPENELIEFARNERNGLVRSVQMGDIEMEVTYRPTDLLVAQELKSYQQPTNDQISVVREKYKNHYYFVLSLSKGGRELLSPANQGVPGFSDLLQTISFRLGEKVFLTTQSQDTIAAADYVYNRTFGMGQSTDILFVFDNAEAVGQEYIHLNFDEFGIGIGKQSFRFFIRDLEGCPKIFKP